MIIGVEHIAIYAKDTKALAEWYVRMFDGEIVHDNGKGNYFVAFANKTMIEFSVNEGAENQITDLNTPGLRHIALYVDDINSAAEKVKNSGAEILKDVVITEKGVGTMFFRDPEGNILHFIARPAPMI